MSDGEPGADVSFGVVRARRIEIEAVDGSLRIELGVSERGDAVVRLRDRDRTIRAVVAIQEDAPRVRLLDRQGQIRLCCILRDDQPGIELLGSDGRPRLVMFLRAHEDNAPDLYFIDSEGDPRFGVAMDANGHITLAAKSDAGELKDVQWMNAEVGDEAEPLY